MSSVRPLFVPRLLACLLTGMLVATLGCGSGSSPTAPSTVTQTDLRVGTGAEAVNGRRLFVNYTGWLQDAGRPEQKGQQFDSSTGRAPFAFVLGAGQVIPGWDQGIVGMRVGGMRRLVIPPSLGYGSGGSGPIPGNATLVFDVELVDLQ